ncbi:MAG: AraC family transcriptional regulator [Blautia sp.]|nr:AraC family transcriptional regulator [Blautia sp.]MCM1199986.1 AraC family transcriptional regulator [Bacteroides fragilis]
MRETLVKHQSIQYQHNEPFSIVNVFHTHTLQEEIYVKNSHWHEELELLYVFQGHSRHYIDGEVFLTEPGRLLVTNCESVHRIEIPEEDVNDPETPSAVVLLIHNRFLEENFPEYRDFWFANEHAQARPEVRDIMLQFSVYAGQAAHSEYQHLYMRGLSLQLLYYLYQEGAVKRTDRNSVRRQEQVQTLKEILQYVELHYREPLAQADVAKEFCFNPQYFARYFKQCTGETFTAHLAGYRANEARKELLYTDCRIGDIARDNGFGDDRSFINTFKRIYRITPLQYRKQTIR